MKRIVTLIFSLLLLLAGLSQNAFAFPSVNTYWNLLGADAAAGDTFFADNAVDDSVTETFKELTYYAETTSVIQNGGAAGAQVVDAGRANVSGLNAVSGSIPPDNEGYGSLYGMTFVWNNLTGTVDSNDGDTITASYYSGTIDFYLDYNPYEANRNDVSSLTDGLKVATVEITSGSYELDLTGNAGSSYLLYGEFTELISDFWYDENGEDLSGDLLTKEFVLAYSAGDTDPQNTIITDNPDGSITVDSPHDSSIEVGIVPEPTTFLLLGFGLLGFAGIGRKRLV